MQLKMPVAKGGFLWYCFKLLLDVFMAGGHSGLPCVAKYWPDELARRVAAFASAPVVSERHAGSIGRMRGRSKGCTQQLSGKSQLKTRRAASVLYS